MNEENQDQRIQELLLLQRVAQKINSILDLEKLLEEIVGDPAAAGLKTFGYLRSGVLLVDEEANELEIAAVRGWTKNYHIKGDRFKIGVYGIIGHVAATGETYYSPDVTVDPYYQVSEESTRSEVDIPLKINDKLIGVFDIQHHETNAFNQQRIKLLESLANHIAIAIENARLFTNERREKERMLTELKVRQLPDIPFNPIYFRKARRKFPDSISAAFVFPVLKLAVIGMILFLYQTDVWVSCWQMFPEKEWVRRF